MNRRDVQTADNRAEQRYEVSVAGTPAGFAQYRAKPGLIAFIHTEIDEQMKGQGLATQLITFALSDARARGMAVLPFCPFVNEFIKRHDDYLDLVPAAHREEFGL